MAFSLPQYTVIEPIFEVVSLILWWSESFKECRPFFPGLVQNLLTRWHPYSSFSPTKNRLGAGVVCIETTHNLGDLLGAFQPLQSSVTLFQKTGLNSLAKILGLSVPRPSTQQRINLSPFTKDFRVWGAQLVKHPISLWDSLWGILIMSIIGLQRITNVTIWSSGAAPFSVTRQNPEKILDSATVGVWRKENYPGNIIAFAKKTKRKVSFWVNNKSSFQSLIHFLTPWGVNPPHT